MINSEGFSHSATNVIAENLLGILSDAKRSLDTIASIRVDHSMSFPQITVVGVRTETEQPIIQLDFALNEIREYELRDKPLLVTLRKPQTVEEWYDFSRSAINYHFGYIKV